MECYYLMPYHRNQLVFKSNQFSFVTCAEYNRFEPYSEMLTYKPLTTSAVLRKMCSVKNRQVKHLKQITNNLRFKQIKKNTK